MPYFLFVYRIAAFVKKIDELLARHLPLHKVGFFYISEGISINFDKYIYKPQKM